YAVYLFFVYRYFYPHVLYSFPTRRSSDLISGLICSLRVTFPPSRISWMCDRSSRVSGSIMANSSSIPRVNVWFFFAMAEKNHTLDRKSTRLNSSHGSISYAVFCLIQKTYI